MYDRSWYQPNWQHHIPDYSSVYDVDDRIPVIEHLCEALQQEYQAHYYVQLAVCHDLFAQAMLYVAKHWLWSKDQLLQSLALHYIRSLGARYQCHHVVASLTSQAIHDLKQMNPLWHKQTNQTYTPRQAFPQVTQSYFPIAQHYYCRPSMVDTYLSILSDLLPHHHRILLTAIDWSLQYHIALDMVWQAWPKTRSHLPLLSILMSQQLPFDASKMSQLAIRLVLIHPQEVLAFCHVIANSSMTSALKNTFTREIQKQCKRTGQIRLWGEGQRIFRLAGTHHAH